MGEENRGCRWMWTKILRCGETEEEYFCYDFTREGGNLIHLTHGLKFESLNLSSIDRFKFSKDCICCAAASLFEPTRPVAQRTGNVDHHTQNTPQAMSLDCRVVYASETMVVFSVIENANYQ